MKRAVGSFARSHSTFESANGPIGKLRETRSARTDLADDAGGGLGFFSSARTNPPNEKSYHALRMASSAWVHHRLLSLQFAAAHALIQEMRSLCSDNMAGCRRWKNYNTHVRRVVAGCRLNDDVCFFAGGGAVLDELLGEGRVRIKSRNSSSSVPRQTEYSSTSARLHASVLNCC